MPVKNSRAQPAREISEKSQSYAEQAIDLADRFLKGKVSLNKASSELNALLELSKEEEKRNQNGENKKHYDMSVLISTGIYLLEYAVSHNSSSAEIQKQIDSLKETIALPDYDPSEPISSSKSNSTESTPNSTNNTNPNSSYGSKFTTILWWVFGIIVFLIFLSRNRIDFI